MTQDESLALATRLLSLHGKRAFDLSMADEEEYDLMRTAFDRLDRATGPDGEFFVVRVFAGDDPANAKLVGFPPSRGA